MKRFDLAIVLALLPIDFFALMGAAITAYFLRFEQIVTQYRPVLFDLTLAEYVRLAIPVALIWIAIFALSGLYSMQYSKYFTRQIKLILVASGLGFAAITIMIFLRGELFNSRFLVLAASGFALLYVMIARFLVHLMRKAFYRKGIGVRRVVLVGADKNTKTLKRLIEENPEMGYHVVYQLETVNSGTLASLAAELRKLVPDVILQGSVLLTRGESEDLLDFTREYHLDFHYVADLFETKAANTRITTISDIPVIEIKQTPLEGWGRIYKRTFDLIAGGILTFIFLPVMFLIAVAIKLEDRGPIIYKNERAGKNGKTFYLYKFRRLKPEFCTGKEYDRDGKAQEEEKKLIEEQSHREGPLYKITDDPRSTKVGRFIEKTSFDEFPQFFNVLKGDISLVGPRPHQPREVEKYARHHKRVMAIKPGITGLAQISGRSDLDFEEEVRLDTYYIENWSIRLDLAILLKTPLAVLRPHK